MVLLLPIVWAMSKADEQREAKLKESLIQLEDRRKAKHSNTAKGLVYRLFDVITEAKARGYTWGELAEKFQAQGFKIKSGTISYYYRAIKKERIQEQEKTEKEKKQAKEKARREKEKRDREYEASLA